MPQESSPKVNVEISEELHTKLSEHLPHGTRKPVVNRMLWDLVDLLEGEDSELVLGAILKQQLPYESFSTAEVEKYAQNRQPSNERDGDGRRGEDGESHREAERST